MPRYLEGQPVRLEAALYADAALTDPTDIDLTIWAGGIEAQLNISDVTKDSTGMFSHEFTPAKAGDYYYQWSGTGAVIAYANGRFNVELRRKA